MTSASVLSSLQRYLLVLTCCLASCSSFGSRRVNLLSNPDGAEVLSTGGKVLGRTPLLLEGDKLEEAIVSGRLDVVIRAPRHMERQVTLDLLGDDSHTIRLVQLDNNYFSQRFMEDFGAEANELTRKLMTAQGLAFAGKLTEAEQELIELERKYPNLAPIFVLRADIERLRGNAEKAHGYLRRARSIDPRDPVANRLLSSEGKQR